MKSRYLSLGPVEIDGVKEEIVRYEKLPPRADKAGKYSSRDSFLLNDGRYVYRDCDDEDKPHGKPFFYHVIEITDPKLLECLDYFDHQKEKKNRKEGEILSYKHLNYRKRADDVMMRWIRLKRNYINFSSTKMTRGKQSRFLCHQSIPLSNALSSR